MAACTFGSVCGCVALRTASFIIAYFNLAVSIIFSTIMLLAIAAVNSDNEDRRMAQVLTMQFMLTQLHFVRKTVFSVVLLVGLHKIKHNLVRVYLLSAAIFFFIDCNMFVVGLVHGLSAGTVVLRVTMLDLEVFSFLVVRSYYEMEPTYTTAQQRTLNSNVI